METKHITLSVRRLETADDRMERDYSDMALRSIAGVAVALCVASIALAWYGIGMSKSIIEQSRRYTEPEPSVQAPHVVKADLLRVEQKMVEPVGNPDRLDGAAELYVVESTGRENPSPLTDSEWKALLEVQGAGE